MLSRKIGFFVLTALVALSFCATAVKADSVVQITSPSGLGAGDVTALYPQSGGTDVGSSYSVTAGGNTLTFTESGTMRVLVALGGVSGTSWFMGYPAGMNVLYTGNFFNQGTGPMTISFSTPVFEFGFLFQNNNDGHPASGVNTFSLYNGSTLLGTYSGTVVSTDANGNVLLFIGAQSLGAGITSIVINGDNNDFSIGPVTFSTDPLNVTAAAPNAPTPEPGTLVLFGSGLIGLGGVLRRKLRF